MEFIEKSKMSQGFVKNAQLKSKLDPIKDLFDYEHKHIFLRLHI